MRGMKFKRRKPLFNRKELGLGPPEDPDTPMLYSFNMKHPFNRFSFSLRAGLEALGWNEDELAVALFIALHWDKEGSASMEDWEKWTKPEAYRKLPDALNRLQANGFIFARDGRMGFSNNCPALCDVLDAAIAAARTVT
jgi:hypothetical protein